MDQSNPTNNPPQDQTPAPQNPNSQPPHNSPTHNVGMAVICYIGILVIIPLLTDAKHDPFVKFHIKQGLVLLVAWVLGSILFWVPVLGWLLWVCVLVFMIIGIMNAVNGSQKELPVIGKFAEHFHF